MKHKQKLESAGAVFGISEERSDRLILETLVRVAYCVQGKDDYLGPNDVLGRLIKSFPEEEKAYISYILGRYYEEFQHLNEDSALAKVINFVLLGSFEDLEEAISCAEEFFSLRNESEKREFKEVEIPKQLKENKYENNN